MHLPKDHLFVVTTDLPQPPHQPSSRSGSSHQDSHSHRVVIHLDDALVRKTTHGGAIDEIHAPSSVGIDPLTTKAIAEALELTHTSSSSSIISSGSALTHRNHGGDMYPWRVSLRGLLTLIVHETNRSDKEYRLSAARALSFLPWVSISGALAVVDKGSSLVPGVVMSTDATSLMHQKQSNQKEANENKDAGEGMNVFDDYFEQLAALAGIPPYYTIPEEEADSNTTMTGTTIDNKLQSTTKKAEKKGGHQPSGNALFGSRYGIDFNQKRNTLVNRRVTAATTTNVQGGENEEDMMHVTAGEHHSAEESVEVDTEEMTMNDLVEGSVDHEVMTVDPMVNRDNEMQVVGGVNSVEEAAVTNDSMDVVISDNDHNNSSSSSGSSSILPSSAGFFFFLFHSSISVHRCSPKCSPLTLHLSTSAHLQGPPQLSLLKAVPAEILHSVSKYWIVYVKDGHHHPHPLHHQEQMELMVYLSHHHHHRRNPIAQFM